MKLVLRVCRPNGGSYNGFKWPLEVGAYVEAPDWAPTEACGNGLHGWLHGAGNHNVVNIESDSVWLAVEPDETVIDLDAKVKFKSGYVRFVGTKHEAAQFVLDNDRDAAAESIIGLAQTGQHLVGADLATLTGGDGATLTGGDWATLTGGDGATLTGGNRATLTGGDRATLTGGNWATLTGGNRATLTGGDGATLTGGNRATLTGGDGATLTGGDGATFKAGPNSVLQTKYWDGTRYRIVTKYTGEDGIEAGVAYRVKNGNFVRIE